MYGDLPLELATLFMAWFILIIKDKDFIDSCLLFEVQVSKTKQPNYSNFELNSITPIFNFQQISLLSHRNKLLKISNIKNKTKKTNFL
jgi:hypothetical protein